METTFSNLALEFEHASVAVMAESYKLAEEFSQKLVAKVKENASGRPGPNIITGEYVSSIHAVVWTDIGGSGFDVISDAPQAYRLEYGFVGRDALGRNFAQPPFPHFRPAADELEAEWEEACAILADLDARGIL